MILPRFLLVSLILSVFVLQTVFAVSQTGRSPLSGAVN